MTGVELQHALWAVHHHLRFCCSREELESAVQAELAKQWQPPNRIPDDQIIDAIKRAAKPLRPEFQCPLPMVAVVLNDGWLQVAE